MPFDPKEFTFEAFASVKNAGNFREIFHHIRDNPELVENNIRASHPTHYDDKKFKGVKKQPTTYDFYHKGHHVAAVGHALGYSTKFLGTKNKKGEITLFIQDRALKGDVTNLVSLGAQVATAVRKLKKAKEQLKPAI